MKHRHFAGASVTLLLVASLTAVSVAAPPGHRRSGAAASDHDAKTASVTIVEPPFQSPTTWHYQAPVIKVRTGTTVSWANSGAVLHTVTAADHKSFDSKDIRPKQRFSFTFTKPGTYTYFCAYHPWMKGSVVVSS